MKPLDVRVFDLQHTFEPIAMLTISRLMREMAPNQVVELRVYDEDLLQNINRLFPAFENRLAKKERFFPVGNYWRVLIHPKEENSAE